MAEVLIKVCGITNVDDAVKCAELGVDLIGLQVYKGAQRFVRPTVAQAIINAVAPQADVLQTVGVVKDPSEQELQQLLEDVPFDLIQYDGHESPEFCHSFDVPFIKRCVLASAEDAEAMLDYAGRWHLIDCGTAVAAPLSDWITSSTAQGTLMLSGNVLPEVAVSWVQQFAPAVVDISVSVEKSPGRKDHARLAAYLKALRAA